MGISRTVSSLLLNGDFSRKSQNFLTPVYFAPAEGFHLELGTGAEGVKKLEWWATGPNKKFYDIFSRAIRQRDRRIPDDSKDRAYA